jgi:hypothetical protein
MIEAIHPVLGYTIAIIVGLIIGVIGGFEYQ